MTVTGWRHSWQRVADVAAAQHRVVLGSQLRRFGLSTKVIRRLREEGWLSDIRPGAYSTGGPATDWQRAVAAALLVWPYGALSHDTAARVHRIPDVVPGPTPHLTVLGSRQPRLGGVAVHRPAQLDPLDVVDYRGVPVTSPARTLVDLAGGLAPAALARVVDEGAIAGLWTAGQLAEVAGRSGRRGRNDDLQAVLASRTDGPGGAASALELQCHRALSCVAPFETQYRLVLDGQTVILDMAWPHARVGAECDGWAVRSRSRRKFDGDRRRDNLLAANGWAVAHLTSAMTDDEMRAAVIRLLLLSAGAGRG